MDYSLGLIRFSVKYGQDFPTVTDKEIEEAYNEYKEFYAKHHRDHPGTATDCYEEFRDKECPATVIPQPELAVAEAFRVPYQDPLNMVERFQNYIDKKHAHWLGNKINRVPYGTVFQSSGYGKTRLIEQLATKIPTLYVCLRPKESTGYPPVTPIAPEIFLHEYSLTKSATDLWEQQLSNKWCLKFWSEVSTASEKWLTIEENDANLSKGKFPFYDADNPNNRVKIILCIDEARYLTRHVPDRNGTPFRILRRAMKHIAWNGFFAIFLDTLSKISNFAPPLSEDPSSRDDEAQLLFFHPFVRLTTMDIFEKMTGGPAEKTRLFTLKGLVTLLQNKLFGGARSFDDSHKKELSSIAILSVLVCLDISPQSKIASELVGSYMATCVAVSKDRERLLVRYPSEPLLAEAALTTISDEKTLISILQNFNEMLRKGFVDAGARGEVVARIILILAVRSIQENEDWKSSGITVKQLMELLDPAAIDELQSFVDATVTFTHFIPIVYVPEKRSLKEYYRRRCAVILKRNNPGADIMIPVKLSEDRYSYILIQMKNYASNNRSADQSYPESGTYKLKSRFVFRKSDLKHHEEKYITLYWQLGFQGQLREVPPIRKSKRQKIEEQQHPFAHFGLDFFTFLGPIVKKELADLLDAFISPFDEVWKFHDEETGDYWSEKQIMAHDPLVYDSRISSPM
ncbi:10684_t:CDS:2 [Funneliformis caledonium]|uniref:10684_t:CDS:1 n=1 Tax=Funneliformis caledonium TaxID=1117310 RepID=A0A9N9DJI0_9GLOM|nr:10684_t:CDS:2 [Funneliformis caledonium]